MCLYMDVYIFSYMCAWVYIYIYIYIDMGPTDNETKILHMKGLQNLKMFFIYTKPKQLIIIY